MLTVVLKTLLLNEKGQETQRHTLWQYYSPAKFHFNILAWSPAVILPAVCLLLIDRRLDVFFCLLCSAKYGMYNIAQPPLHNNNNKIIDTTALKTTARAPPPPPRPPPTQANVTKPNQNQNNHGKKQKIHASSTQRR